MPNSKTTQTHHLRAMLSAFRAGEIDESELLNVLENNQRGFTESSIGRFDTAREERTGIPEAIFAEGKTIDMLLDSFQSAIDQQEQLVATRLTPAQLVALKSFSDTSSQPIHIDETARIATSQPAPEPKSGTRSVIVLAAGTSDLAVAKEAALMCQLYGLPTSTLFDVGVAGIHRLFNDLDKVREADIVIVAAGMDGALPSVVAGLVKAPVIAVPTSVGYGASFGGISAMLTMLNSCAPGVAVCNIDNGFGAAVLAKKMANMKP